MIGYLKGKVLLKEKETLVLLSGDVGYEVYITKDFRVGDELELFIYTHVREDIFLLFGFCTLEEKRLFTTLIKKVNGIGPKLAVQILSSVKVDDFVSMIESKDIARISKLPKIGRKKAEQIALHLKGVFSKEGLVASKSPLDEQVISSLMNLGFLRKEIEPALSQVRNKEDLQETIKEVLSSLSSFKEKKCSTKEL